MKILNPEIVTINGVCKTYPNGTRAVENISLVVSPGEIFGLIGPNGAGKTTLLKLISGLLRPDQGRVFCGSTNISGNPRMAAQFTGLMPDPLGVYTDLSASEYLEFYARILDLPETDMKQRIGEVVEMLELGPWLNQEVETLSAGWQRRLALGRLLLCRTPVLLLDEPAAGLDITARSELLEIVKRLARENRTVIVSSHILPELQELADRFGIIDKGQWCNVRNGQPFFTRQELDGGLGETEWCLRCDSAAVAAEIIIAEQLQIVRQSDQLVVFKADNKNAASGVLAKVVQKNISVYEFVCRKLELSQFVLNMLKEEHSE